MDIESRPRVLVLIGNRQIREGLEKANAGLENGDVDLIFAENWSGDAEEVEFLLLAEDFNEGASSRFRNGLPDCLQGTPIVFISDESMALIRRFCREQNIPPKQVRIVLKPENWRLVTILKVVRHGVMAARFEALEDGEAVVIEGD